jgi:7-cyano-7-deazaguanine synthase
MLELEALPKHGRNVLLFSGGLDSFLLLKLLKPDIAMRFNIGSRYEKLEVDAIWRLEDAGALDGVKIIKDHHLALGDLEREDAIIPGQNVLFALLASLYGDNIILGAMMGDHNRDKDEVCFAQTSSLLTYMARDRFYDTPERTVQLIAPARNTTKAFLVRQYLEAGFDPSHLALTVSCYNPVDGVPCGKCTPCFRRWVAFRVNGLRLWDTKSDFAFYPGEGENARKQLEQAYQGYRGAEDLDTIKAMTS